MTVTAAWRSARRRLARGTERGEGGVGEERWEERMLGHPFIGSEGERGGRASERNRRQWWCAIMAMKVAVSKGDRPGWWWGVMWGGGVL
jgi:hypothetical protein